MGQLGYYTHYQEPEFGLLRLGVRFYDPETGRFAKRDLLRIAPSLYTYMNNRPVSDVDPLGLFGYWECVKKCITVLSGSVLVPVISTWVTYVLTWIQEPVKQWVCKNGKRTLVTVITWVPKWVPRVVTVVKWVSATGTAWGAGVGAGCLATCAFDYYRDFWEDY